MGIRFNGVWLLLLALALAGCNRNPDPVAKKQDDAPKANPPEQKVEVKPKESPPNEEDRFIEKAKALPPGKVHVELIRSVPAGNDGERAECEWVLLTRFPPPPEKVGKEETKQMPFPRPKWVVVRMTMIASVEKSLEKDQKDKRFVNLRLQSSSIHDSGRSGSAGGGQLITTKSLILSFNASGVFPAMLIGQYAIGEGGKQHAFASKMAPLDELFVPLAKEARTIDLPFTVELARFGEEKIAVALISDNK